MQKILCFGELLLRLSPEPGWPGKGLLASYVGGAELNVAMALAAWGLPVSFGTAMPDNPVSGLLKSYLSDAGVDTDKIIGKAGRIGTYYLTPGQDLKSAGVVYDRAGSSFSVIRPSDLQPDQLLKGVNHLHLTAISPAVSQIAADSCLRLVNEAHLQQIPVSLDLNYRAKLWQYGKRPSDIMPAIAEKASFIMGNIWAAGQMLGINPESGADKTMDPLILNEYARISAEKLIRQYPNCKSVGYTFRFNAPDRPDTVKYFGSLYQEGQLFSSIQKEYVGIIDRAGSWDCFMAGFLYSRSQGLNGQQTVNFATAAATGKFYEKGDHTSQTKQEVEKRMALLQ